MANLKPADRKKDKIERVTGLGRKTRQAIVKWNQMTARRFQTGSGVGGGVIRKVTVQKNKKERTIVDKTNTGTTSLRQGNIGVTPGRQSGAHMGVSERRDTILS